MQTALQRKRRTAVVTGATGGIGAAIVDRCIKEGYFVVAVGRSPRADAVHELSDPSSLVVLHVDLTLASATDVVLKALSERGLEVDLLVNCAGKGLLAPFESAPIEAHCETQRVNFEAPMRLTHALLPQLSSRGGQVVNLASVVGFVAVPNLAALAASKAALFAWSVALREELKGRVGVTTFCPGITRTGFLRTARMQHLGLERWFFASDAEAVARRVLRAAKGNQAVAFTTVWDNLAALATRLVPAPLAAWLASLVLVPSEGGARGSK
jgi:short-subunit dehydrogenase